LFLIFGFVGYSSGFIFYPCTKPAVGCHMKSNERSVLCTGNQIPGDREPAVTDWLAWHGTGLQATGACRPPRLQLSCKLKMASTF